MKGVRFSPFNLVIWVLVALVVLGSSCVAQESRETLKVGTSLGLSGFYAGVASRLLSGFKLAFKEINDTGGIKGREVELICYDDGYDMHRASRNVDKLVLQDKVSVLFATFGTPSNVAIVPRLSVLKTPLFFPISGGIFLYSGSQRYLFTFLPAYRDESYALIQQMKKDGYKRIGIVYIPNQYGWDCKLFAKKKALALGLQVSTFPLRKEEEIASVVRGLRAKKVEALYLAIPPKFVASLLKVLDAQGYYPALYAENYCGLPRILQGLGPKGAVFKNVTVGRFMPILQENYPAIAWYKEALRKYAPDESPDPAVFLGYIMARTLGQILRRVPSLDPKGIVEGAESIKNLDVGLPEKISYGPKDHVGLTKIFVYRYANGVLTPVRE